jgi:hypothetical protein
MTSVDDIINSLILSYNTSDIKKLPEDLREALYEEAKKCLEKSESADNPERCNERKTLMRLIINNQLNKKPVSDLIKGPLSITLHWNSDMKMMIYIFGEFHSFKTDCEVFPQEKYINGETVPVKSMFIEDYMKELLINTDSYIDFFLEEKAHFGYDPNLTNGESVTRIGILRNSFRQCISDIKSRNTNPNCILSRSHYFDIREGNVKGRFDVVSLLINELINLTNLYYPDIKQFIIDFAIIREKFSYFIKTIITTSSDKAFVKFWQDQLFIYPFLNEKMKRSSQYLSIRSFILNEIELESLKYKETMQVTIKKLFSILEKVGINDRKLDTKKCKKESERIIRYVGRFQEALIMVNSTIADGYLLSRVFKEFDINTDKPEKKRGFDEPQRPHNIIIYGGNVHANRCRKFLEHIKFKRLEQNIYDYSMTVSNCVDMKNITQPLFSYIPDDDCVYYKEPYIPINIKR